MKKTKNLNINEGMNSINKLYVQESDNEKQNKSICYFYVKATQSKKVDL